MTENIAFDFFLRMLLGHLVGDFVFQTYKMAMAKRAGWRGLFIHVSIVTFTTAVAIYNTVPNWYIWVIVLFVVHLSIDQFRTFIFTDNSNGKGLLLFIADQTVHILSIMAISWFAVGWRFTDLAQISHPALPPMHIMILLACIVIIAVWATPILEVELATAIMSLRHTSTETMIPVRPSDRLMGGMERLVSLGLIIISWGLFIPLVFLPRLYWLHQENRSSDKTMIYAKTITSFCIAILLSLPIWFQRLVF